RDPEPQPAQQVDGVLGEGRRGTRVDVRGRAHLERHTPIANEGGEPAQLHGAIRSDGDVVDDPDAVAETLRATELERLPDGRKAEALAGVDRDVEVLVADLVERLEVARGPVARLRARNVEADDAG